nr:MAG TPA: hypothetical protein [Crassvirales sp.]
MESRKITIVESKNQRKSVIMSAATTLAELKADLRANGIDYSGMTFFEGLSKVELKTDEAVLPHDVPWKGNITNELVFMLSSTEKKIKSGAMSRSEAFAKIKELNLQSKCVERFSKNFTMCKTADLEALIAEFGGTSTQNTDTQNSTPTAQMGSFSVNMVQQDVPLRNAFKALVECLEAGCTLTEEESSEILGMMDETTQTSSSDNTPVNPELESSFSDDDLDDMFEDMV